MIRTFLALICVALLAGSCMKNSMDSGCPYQNSSISAPQAERDSVKAFLNSLGIQAEEHSSGFFYKVISQGTDGGQMGLCSEIAITYTGWLQNGAEFDKQTNIRFILGSLIEGWKKSIPLIKKGGEIDLYIPPTLAYGKNEVKNNQTGQVIIPSNSMLVFKVKLLDYTVDTR